MTWAECCYFCSWLIVFVDNKKKDGISHSMNFLLLFHSKYFVLQKKKTSWFRTKKKLKQTKSNIAGMKISTLMHDWCNLQFLCSSSTRWSSCGRKERCNNRKERKWLSFFCFLTNILSLLLLAFSFYRAEEINLLLEKGRKEEWREKIQFLKWINSSRLHLHEESVA